MFVPYGAPSARDRRTPWALLLSTAASATGNAVVAVAIPWLVLERTGSATLAGVVGAAALVPLVVSALLGGALVDRWGRLRTSVGADLLSAVAVAAIPLAAAADLLGIPVLVALVALGAVFDGPGMAAREALRPDVARRSGWPLERINGRGEAVDGLAALVGPALAGTLVLTVGTAATLWVTVALFALAAGVSAVGLRESRPVAADPSDRIGGGPSTRAMVSGAIAAREPYWASVVAGLRLIWTDRTLRASALLTSALALVYVPLEAVVLPAWAQRDGGPGALGLVLSAFAAGSVVGALASGRAIARFGRRRLLVVALTGLAAGVGALGVVPGVVAPAVVAAASGLLAGPVGPVLAGLLQERSPEAMRGRVIGASTSLALAAAPLGLLVAGPLVDRIGVSAVFGIIALGCALAAWSAARTPGLDEPPAGRGTSGADRTDVSTVAPAGAVR